MPEDNSPPSGSTNKIDIENPNEIKWIEGNLPLVETVPKGSYLLAWIVNDIPLEDYERHIDCNHPLPHPDKVNGKLRRICAVMPYENDLNPLRWCDSSSFPIGYHERVTHYAWIVKGNKDD